MYKAVCDTFGIPEIHLSASHINKQTQKCVSLKPELQSSEVDAFSITWSHHFMYIFPLFSLLTKVIKKICRNQATGILIFPALSTQPWCPQALELSGEVPLKIKLNLTNLILPQAKAAVHPLAEKLKNWLLSKNITITYLKLLL